jgi:hypothetical protein
MFMGCRQTVYRRRRQVARRRHRSPRSRLRAPLALQGASPRPDLPLSQVRRAPHELARLRASAARAASGMSRAMRRGSAAHCRSAQRASAPAGAWVPQPPVVAWRVRAAMAANKSLNALSAEIEVRCTQRLGRDPRRRSPRARGRSCKGASSWRRAARWARSKSSCTRRHARARTRVSARSALTDARHAGEHAEEAQGGGRRGPGLERHRAALAHQL